MYTLYSFASQYTGHVSAAAECLCKLWRSYATHVHIHSSVVLVPALYLHISMSCIITFRNTCSNRKCIVNVCNNTFLYMSNSVGQYMYIWLIWTSYIVATRIYYVNPFVGLLVSFYKPTRVMAVYTLLAGIGSGST